ncbi:hypothetical protein EDC94DRAFT_625688 [Helicostylum pulchrum]|nr:hypothetical protein EDC94DRAFT_625688 [Helicostylum pulchrum]
MVLRIGLLVTRTLFIAISLFTFFFEVVREVIDSLFVNVTMLLCRLGKLLSLQICYCYFFKEKYSSLKKMCSNKHSSALGIA